MTPTRNLRRSALGLVCLASLLALAAGLRLRSPGLTTTTLTSEENKAVEAEKEEIQFLNERPIVLEPGRSVMADLRGGQGRRYEFSLEEGQFVELMAEQKGVDVELRFFRPDRDEAIVIDSPNWRFGPELIYELAEGSNRYRLEVVCADHSEPMGSYEVRLGKPRTSAEDRIRFDGWRAFRNGESRRSRKAFSEAIEKYEESLALWKSLGDRIWTADTLFRIGWMRRELLDYEAALSPLTEAAEMFRQKGRRLEQALVLNHLGEVRFRLGDWAASVEAHQESLPLFRELGMTWMEASALNGLGNARAILGEVKVAMASYREAQEKARQAEDAREQALALFGIGDVLIYQGDHAAALDALEDSLRLAEQAGDAQTRAACLTRIADLDQRQGNLDQARARLEQALASEGLNRNSSGIAWNSLGTVHLLSGRIEEAGASYRQALALFHETGNRPAKAYALLNFGRYFYEKGDFRKSVALHDEAAVLFRTLENRRGEASTEFGAARALHDLGDYAAAHDRLERVFSQVETLRSESDGLDLRTSFLATRQHYFELLIDVLVHRHEQEKEAGYDKLALIANERRKARGLLDLLAGKIDRDAVDPELAERERSLQDKITALEQEIMDRQDQDDAENQIESLEKQQRGLLRQLEDVRGSLRQRSPRYASLTQPEPLDLNGIRERVMDKNSTLLVYSLGRERSFLWCLQGDGKLTLHILPVATALEDAAQQVHRAWSEPGGRGVAGNRWAARLSHDLLEPVTELLTTRRLVIVADGALQYVPFAALPDPRTLSRPDGAAPDPLVKNHVIVHLPSVSVLATLRKENRNRQPRFKDIAIIADPVFGPDDPRVRRRGVDTAPAPELLADLRRSSADLGIDRFHRLPFTSAEADVIREGIPPLMRHEALGFEASHEFVMGETLQDYKILHFATHGLLNSKHPDLSGLVLSLVDEEGNPRRGFLLAHEIYSLDLPAELVVLSACETGLGRDVRGEGMIGLTRSFMYAGAPRLVVSLWKVDDRGTSELMKRFYRILFEADVSPAKALRCAQISMIDDPRWSSPYYWAPFIYQGEWLWQSGMAGDDGIEKPVGAVGPGGASDDDLPPPIFGNPVGCPKIDFDRPARPQAAVRTEEPK
jgi:CHAT domain-containing protein/tetratricopeptide (TPR) repeat protein